MRVGHQLGLLVVTCTLGGLSVASLLWQRSQELEAAGRAVLEGELLLRDHGRITSLTQHFAATADRVAASGDDYLESVAMGQADALTESLRDIQQAGVAARLAELHSDVPETIERALDALHGIVAASAALDEAGRQESIAALDDEMIHLQQVLDRLERALREEVGALHARREGSEKALHRSAACAGLAYLVAIVLAWRWSVRCMIQPLLRLAHSAEQASEGRGKLQAAAQGPVEVRILARTLETFVNRLQGARDTLEEKVLARTAELQEANAELEANRDQFRQLVETTRTIPFEMDPHDLRFTYVGPQALTLLGIPAEDWRAEGFLAGRMAPEERDVCLARLSAVGHAHAELECRLQRADRTWVWARLIVSSVRGESPEEGAAEAPARRLRGVLLDVTETRRLETELRQAQKLESVGRLAAGVAHEINTPIQFVNDSVHFVRDALGDLQRLIGDYGRMRAAVAAGSASPALAEELERAEEEADLGYLLENAPRAVERSLEGLERVATIVRSMKEFAHPDQKEMAPIDLNQAIRSTLTIARNEYKYVADLETDLEPLPSVTCLAGEVNQVILNIVVNAAHAIGDVIKGTDAKGRITVRTRREGEHVVISIGDTGGGIPPHVRERIFDPFFTTKEVGKGTGQGLAIARSVVVDQHGGELTFETEVGKGTVFSVRLPIAGRRREALEAAA